MLDEKLDYLESRYIAFSKETDKTLLRWLIDPGDEAIVDVFVWYQQKAGEIEDLLMEIKVPFEDEGDLYSLQLVDEVNRQYEEIKPYLEEEGMDASWICPDTKGEKTATARLIAVLYDFYRHHRDIAHHVTLVLRPSRVADGDAFSRWHGLLLKHRPPKPLRFVVLDSIAAPLLDELATEEVALVHTEPLQLDYPSVLEALAKGEIEPQGPDARFRVLLVRLSNQADKKDVKGAEETAQKALAIAEAQSWYHMQVVIHSVLGATYLQVQDFDKGLRACQKATKKARKAKEEREPAALMLEILCLFAEASMLLAMTEYMKAAVIYKEAAPLAEAEKDALLTMEAWRMVAYCHELETDYPSAIYYNELALDAGEKLPAEERLESTLAYVGDALLRVIQAEKKSRSLMKAVASVKQHRKESEAKRDIPDEPKVDKRMTALLGENWWDLLIPESQGVIPLS